jgi:hypothetical protein
MTFYTYANITGGESPRNVILGSKPHMFLLFTVIATLLSID